MKNHKPTTRNAKGNAPIIKLGVLLVLALIILIFMTDVASAAIGDSLRNMGSNIGGFLDNYASQDEPTVIDFFLFAIIFITLCYMGFSKVFKDAKNASVVLSIALGLALSIGLVYGGKFTLKKLLPFAGVILFLLIFLGIFAMLKKFIFTKDTIMSKILSAVVAVIVSIALIALMWNMLCDDDGGMCENNGFLRKIIGSESWLGKLFAGFDSIFVGLPPPPHPSQIELPGQVIANCGNGRMDRGESCDPGGRAGVRRMALGCNSDQQCNNCQNCIPKTEADSLLENIGSKWVWIIVILAFLLMSGLTLWKRKSINERYNNWRNRRGRKHHKSKVESVLRKVEDKEKAMLYHFKELCDIVGNEKVAFDRERHIVNMLTTDIKETIGGEIEFIKTASASGPGGNIFDHIHSLKVFNDATEKTKIDLILAEIKDQLTILRTLPADLSNELKALEKVHELFDAHSDVLNTFKQFNFKEKDFINNMIHQIDENRNKFTEMSTACDRMVAVLNSMLNDAKMIEGEKANYHDMISHIKELRLNSQRLNQMFVWKINMLRILIERMKEVKGAVHQMHNDEVNNLKQNFLDQAERARNNGNHDTAVYLASHVIESARELIGKELEPENKDVLVDMITNAKAIIVFSLPKVFESMKPKIISEFNSGIDTGDASYFKKIMEFAERMEDIDFISNDHNSEFNELKVEHNNKMQKLYALAKALHDGTHITDALRRLLS